MSIKLNTASKYAIHVPDAQEVYVTGDQYGTDFADVELAMTDPAAWAQKFFAEAEGEIPDFRSIHVEELDEA